MYAHIKRNSRFLLALSTCAILLSGCNTDERTPNGAVNTISEPIEDIKFERDYAIHITGVKEKRKALITTDTQTYVRDANHVTFVAATDESDNFTYRIDEDRYMHDVIIALSPDGLKKYSESYGEVFEETLELTTINDSE